MSRFTNDVDAVGEMLNNTIVQLFSGTLTVIGTLCMMLYMNITLSIVTIIMVPIFVKVGGRIASRGRKFFVGQQTALGAVNGYIEESVTCCKYGIYLHRKFIDRSGELSGIVCKYGKSTDIKSFGNT